MNGCLVYCFAGLPWISLGNIKCGADLYYILNFNDSNNEKNSLFCLSGNNVAEKRTYSTCIINQNTTSLQVGGAASLRKLAQFSSCLQSSFRCLFPQSEQTGLWSSTHTSTAHLLIIKYSVPDCLWYIKQYRYKGSRSIISKSRMRGWSVHISKIAEAFTALQCAQVTLNNEINSTTRKTV